MDKKEPQVRHEKLIDLLNRFSQYRDDKGEGICKKRNEQIYLGDLSKLDIDDINLGVVALTDFYNLSAGSAGSVDLYKLLQTYFLDESKRDKINDIIR